MKLYLDEDLPLAIAVALRRKGVDAVSVHELRHQQWSDRAQLEYAAGEGRALVTRNVQDFVAISREALRLHRPHRGIVLCFRRFRGQEIGAIADALQTLAGRYPDGLGEYDVVYVQPPTGR